VPGAGPRTPTALFVSYAATAGGAQRLLLDHAGALDGPVALACPEGPLAERARRLGLLVTPLRARRLQVRGSARDLLSGPARLAAQSREVRHAITELRPRCLVGWSMRGLLSTTGALAGMRRRPPLVFAHNDLIPSPAVGAAVRAAASRAEIVVAASHEIASDLDPTGHLGVQVIHPGVDLGRFAAAPIPGGPPEVLVLGAIVAWKRPELALEAIAIARRELPGLRVCLAGAPLDRSGHELRERLEERACAPDLSGAVRFAGAVADVPGAFGRATCLLHCADREPFGIALVEALACGRPVAAPRAAGPLEILDETCARLYEPGDARLAAAALVDVVRRAPQLSDAARVRAERLFDVRDSTARFRDLVTAVAG